MSNHSQHATQRKMRAMVFSLLATAGLGLTGCQVDVAGQTLPSAYYMEDDVQYFPPGPEFKLSNEANAMRQYQQQVPPPPAAAP